MLTFKQLEALLVFLTAFGLVPTSCLTTGCTPQATEAERAWTFIAQDVIKPIAEKAISETTTRTATIQAGAQVINPGYSVDLEGFWCTGFKGMAVVRLEGVSGQITGHAQGDAGQAGVLPAPAIRTEPTPVPQ